MNIAVLFSAVLVVSTFQQAPVRDGEVTPTTGTASVSGVVVNDETPPRPLARVIVSLTGAGLIPSRGAITDDNGRFTLTGLPAGRFTLTAARASFVTSAYGAKRPGRPGTPIVVGVGASVTGLTMRLWRGAVLAGVVRDEDGKPRENVIVSAVPARSVAGSSLITLTNNGVRTNDLGEFRVFGLEPGPYVLSARLPPVLSLQDGLQIVAPGDAAVDAALDALKRGPTATPQAPSASAVKAFDYAPVFFPGATQLTQAAVIAVGPGEERTGLDFAVQRVATSRIEGVVLRPDGSPGAGARLQMRTVGSPDLFGLLPKPQFSAIAGADGRFTVVQVTPGDYVLLAKAPQQPTPPISRTNDAAMVMPGGVTAGQSLWGVTSFSVVGSDIGDVAMTLQPGAVVSGTIVFDGAAPKPTDLSKISVSIEDPGMRTSRPGTVITSLTFSLAAFAKADGSFALSGLGPSDFVLFVNRADVPANWWLRSAMVGDRDLLDGYIALAPGMTMGGVVITFTDRHTELSGALQTPGGAPASDVFVIAYAADRKFWGPGSRRVVAVRPSVDGKFSIPDLPPGDYLIGAVTDVDQGEWQVPEFLEKLMSATVKVKIGEGEKVVQNLRMGK